MGKGSNIKGLGSSWMKKHTRDLLTYMPIDNRASGKGPGKHGMHKGMAEYGNPKGPGKHGYGPHMEHGKQPAKGGHIKSYGPPLEGPPINPNNNKNKPPKKENPYKPDPNYSQMNVLEKLQHDYLGPDLGGRANWTRGLRRVGLGNYGKS